MSLLKIAKNKAEADRKAEEQAQKEAEERSRALKNSLKNLWNKVLPELKEFDGARCEDGTFSLVEEPHNVDWQPYSAQIKLNRNGQTEDVLFISGRIISGTYDASDDCRDIPYTTPSVTIHTRPEYVSEYGYVRVGYDFNESVTNEDKVEELLHKVAKYMSKYF